MTPAPRGPSRCSGGAVRPCHVPEPGGRRPGRAGPARTGSGLRSGIYEGTVVHHRFEPVDHRFSYRIAMTYDGPGRDRRGVRPPPPLVPGAGQRRLLPTPRLPGGPVAPPRHGGAGPGGGAHRSPTRGSHRPPHPTSDLGMAVQSHQRLLLLHPGWRDSGGRRGRGDQHSVARAHHLRAARRRAPMWWTSSSTCHPSSPWTSTTASSSASPGERLVLGVDDLRSGDRVFSASMVLQRRPADRRSLGRVLWRYPLMTVRVSWGIYRQALALRRRGVAVPPASRPDRSGG